MKLNKPEEGIDYFCDIILKDMYIVSMKMKKSDIMAHIDYWRNILGTIKTINDEHKNA